VWFSAPRLLVVVISFRIRSSERESGAMIKGCARVLAGSLRSRLLIESCGWIVWIWRLLVGSARFGRSPSKDKQKSTGAFSSRQMTHQVASVANTNSSTKYHC
jgi:hypothetical protein